MAVASYDAQFSFQQDSVARLGDRGVSGKLSEEQQKKFNESPAMIAARKSDELAQQYTNARDNQRMITDTFFRAEDSDWSAPKSYDYKRTVDYYNILGVEEHATLEEVKAAYKKLSLIYHPDKTKGLPPEQQEEYAKVFISVKNAHLVLADKPTRRQYDYDRDHDRAKAEVQGTNVHQEQHIDLTEVLERIKEMQRPPGQNVVVPVQCKLEKFFYGGRKELQRKRTIKDFYQGFVTEQHTYRVVVTRGAAEPLEVAFKEQGDWHSDTRPDTVTLRLSSKPHPSIERLEGTNDLLARQEVQLDAEAPGLVADLPGLRGRHVLLWGPNPLRGAKATGMTSLELCLRGEGLSDSGALRLRLRTPGLPADKASAATPTLSRESARALLSEAVRLHSSWRQAGARDPGELKVSLSALVKQHGCVDSKTEMDIDLAGVHHCLSTALQQVRGEWALAAKVSALLAEGNGTRPSLASFLSRHGLAGPSSTEPESAAEAGRSSTWESWVPPASSVLRYGSGGLCEAASMSQRSADSPNTRGEVELVPLGEPTSLFTVPICTVRVFTNAAPLPCPGGPLAPRSLFALCLSSQACGRKRATGEWDALRAQLLPLLQSTAFLLLPSARQALPQPLADFATPRSTARETAGAQPPAPWKRLADEAFHRGDCFEAFRLYALCLEAEAEPRTGSGGAGQTVPLAARVRCNRALCLIRLGAPEAALTEAQAALELRPDWPRAHRRAAAALAQLGPERRKEALAAAFRAAELAPFQAELDALAAAAAATHAPEPSSGEGTAEAEGEAAGAVGVSAAAERERARAEGTAAYRSGRYGSAAAQYTVALVLVPGAEDEAVLRAVLHSNRCAALCRLKHWPEAAQDGRAAVAAQPAWAKAHIRLGTALLGQGDVEHAYTEFAWALLLDNGSETARQGQEAALCALPLWRSPSARQRQARFSMDMGRPRGSTRIFALSDLHYDYKPNEEWVHRLDELEYREDVLILAGNVANTHYTFVKALRTLKSKFRRIFYVPGNEDVWMNPGEVHNSRFPDSFAKFLALLETCDELGVDIFPAAVCHDVYVVPILSWYNAQFDKKSRPDPNYAPDETCVWPLDSREQLWKYMLKLNESLLQRTFKGTVLSFSHFLPLSTLPFSSDGNIRAAQSMGCEDIEDSIRLVRSTLHVYGHSGQQACEEHGGTLFVNRYHGYAAEQPQDAPPPPLCLFNGSQGIVVSDTRRTTADEAGKW